MYSFSLDSYGHNFASLIADLFLCCYERDLMTHLQTSKPVDLIDMFNYPFTNADP